MLLIQARLLTPILEGEKPEFMDFETPPSLQGRQKFLSQRASCFETWPYYFIYTLKVSNGKSNKH